MCAYVCLSLYAIVCRCPQGPEEGAKTWVPGSGEPPAVGAEKMNLWRAANALTSSALSPAPFDF